MSSFHARTLLRCFCGKSIGRFFNPVPIAFNQAIGVAVAGLVVNAVCAFILGIHHHDDDHENDHDHEHEDHEQLKLKMTIALPIFMSGASVPGSTRQLFR